MILDDTHLLTGAILADFMEADPRWEEVLRDGANHFAIYRKRLHPVHDDDWTRQSPTCTTRTPQSGFDHPRRRPRYHPAPPEKPAPFVSPVSTSWRSAAGMSISGIEL